MMGKLSKGIKNIIFSLLSQIIIMALSFILPRLLISGFGSQVNGFFNTVTQLFSYLEILRAGVGMAAIQALYKPIVNNNEKEISKIISTSKSYFNKLGVLYLILSLGIGIFFTFSKDTGLMPYEVFLIVAIQGITGWISFSLINWFVDLLRAEGKNYIFVVIQTVCKIFTLLSEIVVIYLTKNAVLVKSVALFFTIIQFLLFKLYRTKFYKKYNFSEEKDYSLLKNRRSYLAFHVSSLICTNTDIVVLSFFCGYAISSVYSVYYLIVSGVNAILNAVYSSTSFILGHHYQEGLEKFEKTHNAYLMLYTSLTTSLFSICYVLMIPFIKLYTNGVADINYIYEYLPLLFCIIQILSCLKNVGEITINVAGLAKKVVWRSILEAAINIVVSIVLVHFFSIYGVLLGTIIALTYRVIDISIFTSKNVLHKSPFKNFKILVFNLVLFFVTVVFSKQISLVIESYFAFIVHGIILSAIVVPIVFGLNFVVNLEESKFLLRLVKNNHKTHKSNVE